MLAELGVECDVAAEQRLDARADVADHGAGADDDAADGPEFRGDAEPGERKAGGIMHGGSGPGLQVKLTLGALRSVGSSILNNSAGRKPNMPAKITLGNVSRVVL